MSTQDKEVLTPGTVKETYVNFIYTYDPARPPGDDNPRSYRRPDFFEYSGYVGSDWTRVICRTTRTIKTEHSYAATVEGIVMSDAEIMATEFKRYVVQGWHYATMQANLFKEHGYAGPVPGGTARGLVNAFTALGYPDNVRRGYFIDEKSSKWGFARHIRKYCYVFKSPRPELSLKDFVRLARAYRDGKGLRRAIQKLIESDGADFANTLETLTALDTLAGLGDK
jgi:hypothetical protein